MKFSESWLRQFVNPSVSRDELSHQITMAGLEVDELAPVAGEFSGVVVGKVVECGQHPDADKLRVTKIDAGTGELIDIVCGAANCRQGLTVAVAMVGAVLPGNFKIKKAKLRGQPSFGMLCSFGELGIDIESDGIIELPSDAVAGTDVREYLDLNDVSIDVDLTANRADCLSLLGMAREVGVRNAIDLTLPTWQDAKESIATTVAVNVEAQEACPRYLSRVIEGVDVSASTPLWMSERLRRSGIRSIDPIVDVTNYVLIELGQPMHAFDLDTLKGGLTVRMAKNEEKLTLLDGAEATLNEQTLVIADDERAVAMAGIFGGQATGVTENSKNIVLECAFFNRTAILGKARSYGLHTDSSHRYERGVDPLLQAKAMERATQLIVEICGGSVGPVVEAVSNENLPKQATITLTRQRLDKILGHHVEDEKVLDILVRLGFETDVQDGAWVCQAPSYRFDMAIEEDLIEEVARIYGYNNIPNTAPKASLVMPKHNEAALPLNRVKNALVTRGFQEAVTYSFVDPKLQEKLHPAKEMMILPHPISTEMSAMRLSLWTGLLSSVSYNQKRQQPRVRLFESGLRFIPNESAPQGVEQTQRLAGVISGTDATEHWDGKPRTVDFFDLKGDVEAILQLTQDESSFEFVPAQIDGLHPGQSAHILRNGEVIGSIGTLHPSLEKPFGVNGRCVLFELSLDALLTRKLPKAQPVSKFPANRRDIAVVVAEEVSAGKVTDLIKKVGGNQLVGVNLFDVYQGKGVEDGYKSLAIALTLQNVERTLEEKEISDVVETVVTALESELNASLRD